MDDPRSPSPDSSPAPGNTAHPASPDADAKDAAPKAASASTATRDRILDAASAELARAGYAGARMESIAELAGIRKQVIYYYFPSKADLAREVLVRSNRRAVDFWTAFRTATLTEVMRAAVERAHDTPDEVAHLLWEGQEYQNHLGLSLTMEPSRARDMRLIIDLIQRSQAAGDIDASLPSDLLGLSVILLSLGPAAYPQIVPIVAGTEWNTPEFTARWAQFCMDALTRLTRPS